MRARLLVPSSSVQGQYLEHIAIFAARRCRTTKDFGDLIDEVEGYSLEKRANFLHKVVQEDWAADVLEMIHLVYDIEGIPMWMVVELLRHRLLAREFSLEQLSQRAINAERLNYEAPLAFHPIIDAYLAQIMKKAKELKLPPEELRKAFPQGVLVNFVIGGNLRAFHHFFFMRSSPLFGGKGGAHPDFMKLADQMQAQARERLPHTMVAILPA